mgnify:CR=1 FL=1
MTGKMVTARSGGTVLRHSLGREGWYGHAFAAALSDAIARPEQLAARLFSIRAEGLPDRLPAARARRARLLIGADVAGARPWWLGRRGRFTGPATGRGGLVSALAPRSAAPAAAPRRCQSAPSALPHKWINLSRYWNDLPRSGPAAGGSRMWRSIH